MPTLIIFKGLAEEGVADGLPQELAGKLGNMMEKGMEVVEQAHRLGVQMAYGTDLIGAMHRRQSEEFELRADLVPAADLVRSVTVTGARLIRRENEIGRVANGYRADLIAVEGNPLENVRLLANPTKNIKLIMQGRAVVKDETLPLTLQRVSRTGFEYAEWTLGAVGDVFINRPDPVNAFRHCAPLLRQIDLVFGNCEGAFTHRPHYAPSAGWRVVAREENGRWSSGRRLSRHGVRE